MKIITGYRGEPHITGQQDRDINMGVFGSGLHIIDIGSKLATTIVSANEVLIADGLLIADGCAAEVPRGTSESMAIENGTQGMRRIDLIVARYTQNSGTGVEDMQLAVITGTPAASNPATPSYNTGSIANGDTLVDFPLYTVNLNGISIESVTRNVDYIELATSSALESARTALTNLINTTKTQLQNSINALSSTLSTVSGRVGTATLNTSAKNALAAINELLSRINTLTSNLATTNSNVTAANNRINTTNSNVASVTTRVSNLETKTSGLVRMSHVNIEAGATQYLQLHDVSMYTFILNGAGPDNGIRGIYLVGTTGANAIGIKAVSAASSVTISDAGSGLIKIVNGGYVVLRVSIICTYGTAV